MPKQSAYLKRLQLDKALAIERDRAFTMQWCADAAILAANEVFKRRGEKLVEFALAMQRYSQEIASLTMVFNGVGAKREAEKVHSAIVSYPFKRGEWAK